MKFRWKTHKMDVMNLYMMFEVKITKGLNMELRLNQDLNWIGD